MLKIEHSFAGNECTLGSVLSHQMLIVTSEPVIHIDWGFGDNEIMPKQQRTQHKTHFHLPISVKHL